MASGHVNRTNRPNTWPHRSAKRREVFPCQLGAVHTWLSAVASARPFCEAAPLDAASKKPASSIAMTFGAFTTRGAFMALTDGPTGKP